MSLRPRLATCLTGSSSIDNHFAAAQYDGLHISTNTFKWTLFVFSLNRISGFRKPRLFGCSQTQNIHMPLNGALVSHLARINQVANATQAFRALYKIRGQQFRWAEYCALNTVETVAVPLHKPSLCSKALQLPWPTRHASANLRRHGNSQYVFRFRVMHGRQPIPYPLILLD